MKLETGNQMTYAVGTAHTLKNGRSISKKFPVHGRKHIITNCKQKKTRYLTLCKLKISSEFSLQQ